MKPPVLRSTLFAMLCVFLCPPVAGHASPSPADSVHFCLPFDYEQWRREHPLPAGKWAADLNVGEPRTVRMIYFLPNDRPYRAAVVDSIRTTIRQVQTFFVEQMEAHGYGKRTFRLETDAHNEPLVHRVDGQHPERVYSSDASRVIDELGHTFDLDANVHLIGSEVSYHSAFGVRRGKNGGFVFVGNGPPGLYLAAHELGHAFGLRHDFSDGAYLMSYGPGRDRLSACHAEFLAVHPYFNPDVPIGEGPPPTLELLSPRAYPAESLSVGIRLDITAPAVLHQVQLWVDGPQGLEVKACRSMAGDKEAVVEFQYDGVIPSTNRDDHYSYFLYPTSLSDPPRHPISVLAVDADGNVGSTSFVLEEFLPYHIGTLEGHSEAVGSVSFSMDGKLLASSSFGGSALLWETASRKQIANLGPGSRVAFSPSSTVLAHASGGRVKLWDVATREDIATLEGHTGEVRSMAFSLDGVFLATGSWDNTVKLWDVAKREPIATLEGHTDFVHSVALSPDGTLLASASSYGTALLWDVAKRERIAIVGKSQRDITSVAFSPDGLSLAVATLESSEIMGSTVRLWDVVMRKPMVAFGHPATVWSVAFSPDGATLASGSGDGTIALWDVSEWTGPRPVGVEIISGVEQQGSAGATLAKPFFVLVVDQNGDPVVGATVTFTVTAGGGTLSVATATTDENGRAATTLTLGSQPGTNTVVATVKELEPMIFTATARAREDFDGDGTVGFGDFVQFAAQFGLSQGDEGYDARYDLDGNGAIGFSDFLIFASAFGKNISSS